jgi:hypothetical protein
MNFLKRNKYHLAGLAGVIILFTISAAIRTENLSTPLTRHHERITAHTLITCDIWEKNGGPSNYYFSPVYTYPGEGNQNRQMLGGITDKNGNVYYVSYPPFAFLFAYYGTMILGGPDTDSIRSLNLIIHLFCALFIYLIAATFLPEHRTQSLSIAGLTGAFLYLFSNGNLWAHGNLYFSDTLVQLFIIPGLYFTILFLKGSLKNPKGNLLIVGLIFFFAAYTEWLGIFFSFFVGITLLIFWFVKKESRFLHGVAVVGSAALLALVITIVQYSSIGGWNQFKEVSLAKYEQGNVHYDIVNPSEQARTGDTEAYDFMLGKIDHYYVMAENFLGIFAIILAVVILIPNARRRIEHARIALFMLLLLSVSILLHYYLFFNFNLLHDFSSLKTGFAIILFVVVAISMISSALSVKLNVVLFLAITYLAVEKGLKSVDDYTQDFPLAAVDWNRIATGELIQKYAKPEQAVFVNISSNPELVYAAKHNVIPIKDTSELLLYMNQFDSKQGQYYHHREQQLEYIQEFEKQGENLIFTRRMHLNPIETGAGKSHQK